MAKIDGIRIRNFRALQDIRLGKLWNLQQAQPLTPMTAVIGKNGVGKSTLFDAFGFLADCLRSGVEEACDIRGRGGFERIRSLGADGPIEFEVYYKEEANARPITYEVSIDLDDSRRPCVRRERLRQRRKGQKHGRPFSFLLLNEGQGVVWKGEGAGQQVDEERGQLDLLRLIESIRRGEDSEVSPCTSRYSLKTSQERGPSTSSSQRSSGVPTPSRCMRTKESAESQKA